ncbi:MULTISPECIES: tRNA pseudouridine(55) synthase TruB [unclassified Tolypothrix]|uniref:tRNA pseudouridine(55) synthase TruB n=1 Tax=unclassified Tolypothrix TaxID=2649714 RepID=UPI0005EAC4E9|nr:MULTISPECIES: tRNA pseudouridine(55) synthase TruB [unclassified Tolypothrix]BAY92161.1 tRNA pseudouridine synthase B [Microchaete diplosiphon NIES-3275]EKF04607.1 tRNA pseudouridine synthase B [Tolypothrix sp. PCC 7601]MBE9087085.1 tRNA pseudouridine(55) synthase TruB [Tolypothrix sp. LEGE 11397]UYD26136.1 tRNA pseudouridine(55) synthase TruB [Tolypothrix sp. PCC 7712]UYD31624.1 tRNA pseudouridine(55) synthase TruB [Tolypothrix sp. PCC 7601]
MQGFLNLNKPFDWTSHDCVARVRKLLRLKRVGHAGTLDPAATGVLPIAFGRATRLLQYLPGNKAYNATIRFGVQTTTDDLQGEVITSAPCPQLSLTEVETALPQFLGKIEQIPPSYSAIQVDGQRLYDLARRGEKVEVPVRTVEVLQMEILAWREGDFPELDIAIACGSGTYIRAIARDLGAVLQTGGTLAALTRTASSGFDLAESLTLSDLETQLQAGTFQPIPLDAPLQHLPAVVLPATSAQKWCQGQRISVTTDISGNVRVYEEPTRFLGIGQVNDEVLIPTTVVEI